MTILLREVLEDEILDPGTPDTPGQAAYTTTEWVREGTWSTDFGSFSGVKYRPFVERVVQHPATPFVAGRPAITRQRPGPGWDAHAVSQQTLEGDRRARFNIGSDSPGVAIGLIDNPNTLYGSIGGDLVLGGNGFLPGLLFQGDKVYNLQTFRNGVPLASYTPEDRFSIEIDRGGTVMRFRQNARVLWQEPNPYGPGVPLYLSAALYDRDAVVSNAEFAPLAPKDGVRGDLAPLQLFATDTPGNQMRANLLPAEMRAGAEPVPASGVRARVGALTLRAGGPGTGSGVRANVGPLTLRASGPLPARRSGVRAALRPLVMVARGSRTPMPPNPDPDPPAPDLLTFVDTAELDIGLEAIERGAALVLAIAAELDVEWVAVDGGAREALPIAFELDVGFLAIETFMERLDVALELDLALEAVGADDDTWAVNLAGGGATRYTSFPFRSYARIGRRYYGAGQLGICELTGDTDAGNPIDAVMDLGEKDFGSIQKKKPVEAWITLASLVPMVMQLRAEGALFTYRTEGAGPYLQARRVKFGKGAALQTTFINPVLRNEGGADFTIDALQFDVQVLSRKN